MQHVIHVYIMRIYTHDSNIRQLILLHITLFLVEVVLDEQFPRLHNSFKKVFSIRPFYNPLII